MALLRKTLAFNYSKLDRAVREVLKSKKGTYEHFHYLYGNNELMVFCEKETSFLFLTQVKSKQYLFNLKNRTVVKVTHGNQHHTNRSHLYGVAKIQQAITENIQTLLSHSSKYKPDTSKIDFIYNAICKIASLFSNIPNLKSNSEVYPNLHLSPIFKNTIELPIQSIKDDVKKILESKSELTYSEFSIKKKCANHKNNDRKFFKKVNKSTSLSLIIDGEGSAYKFKNADNIIINIKKYYKS